MNLLNYQNMAMRTNDGKDTERLMKCHKRCNPSTDIGAVINACMGLPGEVGETIDLIKKWMFGGHNLSYTELKEEISDVMWYLALMCYAFGFSLEEIAQININKLLERYPEGYSEHASQHRKEYNHE